ncbi:Transposase MuDR plant [Arabidopsis suecica]|uniref:Transposase MuDR plant n=1 Tax=Arabidopsis suecica TaxID=45249 RepID=A0A8T2BAV6_ARASU|nr:Transposase MuDR plant [Arabidopsis suecica]
MAPRKKSKRRPKRKRDDESTAPDVTAHESTPGEGKALMLYVGEPVPLEQRSSFSDEEDRDDCGVASDDDFDDIGYEAAGEENGEEENGNQEEEEEDGDPVGVEKERCDDFEAEFGDGAREEKDETDADSGDDIFNDEKIPDPRSESEDEDNGERDDNAEAEDPEVLLSIGKTFSSPEDFKIAVLRYSLKTRYDIKLYRSQSMRIGAKCADKDVNCQWRCYCAYEKKQQKMRINVFMNRHICVRSGYTHMLKRGTMAWLFADRLRRNPKMTKQEMVTEFKREYNLEVTEEQCSEAKSKVRREARASHQEHFSRIWDYQAEIFRSNNGSVFDIETIPGQQLGHLLAAVGRDGDNRIVPLAWAVVEIENDDNWDWFMRLLSTSLGLEDGRDMAVISDKQSGLVKAIHNILPQAEHRQCAKHIMDNWKRDSHDMELQRMFWRIARSYTTGQYAKHMEALQKYNPHAYTSLLNTNPMSWSRAFFKVGTCCNDNLNNLSESFNRTIRQARRKPLLELLEDIRNQCMVRNEKRHIISRRLKTRFTKRAHMEIERMIEGSQFCTISMARHNKYEVELHEDKYFVDMNEHKCGCIKWQMTGIPCVHAAAVIISKKQKVEDFVSDWYTTRMWQLTYADGIEPVQGQMEWPRMNRLGVLPPPWRKGNPGRPNNHARRKERNQGMSCLAKDKHGKDHNQLKDHTVQLELHREDHKPLKDHRGSHHIGGSHHRGTKDHKGVQHNRRNQQRQQDTSRNPLKHHRPHKEEEAGDHGLNAQVKMYEIDVM